MAKQLNVNLAFSADTGKAKAQLQDLQQTLQKIATLPGKTTSLFDDTEIKKASQAALELQQHLNSAVNVNTGKLDLSRFSTSLKSAGKDLQTYYNQLIRIGPEGQEAFLKIAQSISLAEAPVTRVNKALEEFGTTLKNTARWQISSSILHGFMGTLQTAYGYAQDLDKSLNDIRIVTGLSVDEMDKFAAKANRAAKSLSTTTTAYTDAALIFYQQGLSSSEVEERTNVTIKMAQVAGEDATEVSSYMTAIWNNFDDGSKSLEYYGDVMQALGAKTAASSAEIAEGLEKFAAIGDTVGLSFEYATAAVATVVDKTRQSADTVGTAFKTIFARLQGLQLGETLEDGVDLNKYSIALQKVGIEVLDLNGNLKDADIIINELGATWNTLSRAQQTALAQTVAGTRQYAQLISLMENFDAFQENVASAEGSEGALSIGADIYAQSWEAAQKRVQTAAQGIYDSLLDEDFFIGVANTFEKILTLINGFVDGLGGMKGALLLAGTIFTRVYAQAMPKALENLRDNLLVLSGHTGQLMEKIQNTTKTKLGVVMSDANTSDAYKIKAEGILRVTEMQQRLVKESKNITTKEKEEYEARIRNVQAIYDEVAALAERNEALQKQANISSKNLSRDTAAGVSRVFKNYGQAEDKVSSLEYKHKSAETAASSAADKGDEAGFDKALAKAQQYKQALEESRVKAAELELEVEQIAEAYGFTADEITNITLNDGALNVESMTKIKQVVEETTQAYKNQVTERKQLDVLQSSIKSQADNWKHYSKEIQESDNGVKKLKKNISSYVDIIKKMGKEKGFEVQTKALQELEKTLNKANPTAKDLANAFGEFEEAINPAIVQRIQTLDDSLEQLDDKMGVMGFETDALKQMRNDAEAAAESVTQLGIAQENAAGQANEGLDSQFKMSVAITQFGSVAMATYATLTSISQAQQILFDENASALEKMGAAISVVVSASQLWNSIMTVSETLLKNETISTLANNIAKKASAIFTKSSAVASGALSAAKTGETAAVTANTVAWYANPIMWIAIIILGVVAAVALLVAGIMKFTEWLIKGDKIETENCETLIENAERTKELAEANEELSDTMNTLINDYDRLNQAGKNTAETLEDIKEKMPDLIDSYRQLSEQADFGLEKDIDELERLGNLANLTGDYSDFTAKKKEIDKEVAIGTAEAARTGAENANMLLAAGMQEKQGRVSGKEFSLDVGGAGNWFNSDDEEEQAKRILQNNMSDYFKDSDSWFKSGAKLTLDDYTNPVDMVNYYESMVKARDQMLDKMSDEDLKNSDIFREINEQVQAGASAYEKAKEQADEYIKASGKALEASMQDASEVNTMEEYLAYKDEFIRKAKEEYKLTEEQAEGYLKQVEGLDKLVNQYELATIMAEKFGGSSKDSLSNDYYKQMSALFGEMTEQELEVAVAVAAKVDNFEDFQDEFQVAIVESSRLGFQQSADIAQQVMHDAAESGKVNFGSLLADENFISYLEEMGIEQVALTAKTYEEQYAIVSQYYSKLNGDIFDSFSVQQDLYAQQIADTQAELNAFYEGTQGARKGEIAAAQKKYADKQSQLSNTEDEKEIEKLNQEMKELEEQFKKDYGFEITSNAETIQNEMDKLLESIDKLQQQKIEIAMDWSGVDEVEAGMEQAAEFAKLMSKDAKKVGKDYELTAKQARKWLEVYPELGDIAETTTEGIIKLDAKQVDEFIAGKDEEIDKTIDAEIKEYESQKRILEEELAATEVDLKAAEALAQGKMNLENVTAQYLVDTRKNLTDYFVDSGLDEVAANKAALETMGMNEQEYSKAVADAAKKNAENVSNSAEDGANAQQDALTQVVNRWGKFGTYLKDNIGTLLKNIGAAILDPTKTVGDVMKDAWDASAITLNADGSHTYESASGEYKFNAGQETERQAVYKEIAQVQLDSVTAVREELLKGINSLDGKIDYLRALQYQDLADYGDDGSGKDKDKSKDLADLKEMSERYHEITREIQMMEHELDRLGELKDRAFGKAKIAIMDQEIETLKKLAEKQQELADAQELYLILDKAAVSQHFANATFDENGNISNYTQLLQAATDELNAAEKAYEASAQEDADKKALERAQDTFEKKTKVLEQYEETLDAWMEQQAVVQDTLNQVQDATYDKLTYKLELGIDVNEREMAEAEYYLNKLSEDFYAMAEAGEYLKKNIGKTGEALGIYENHYNDLNDKYAAATISQDQYIEGLKETYDGIMSNLEGLNDLDKEMLHYYEDTLSMASEETDYYISQMEHLSGVLDHYRNIVELVNGEYDYEAIGTILEGQAKTRENEMAVATAEYEMLLSEKKAIEEQMASVEVGSAAWDLYNEELQAITQATMEAEEEMLSKTEAWAESMKAIMENTFATAAYEMEMMMTQGLGFDALNNSLDKLSTFQEEYLTNTNEIFELEKMMRTAQQAADKTNNEAAKIKLKNYQNEIDTLKNDGLPLSQLELDIQKAKYDLLLAEIALEEAQNAKSTVRLQRDSEGNFGYVYTADTEAISSAEQDLADAQNNLYNIGLEGTNDYGQKLLELQNQLSDDLIALEEERAAGRFKTDEEYYAAKNDLITHYNNLFTAYSNQYTTALGVDNRIQEDAWVNAYQNMIVKTENWKDYTKEYTQECEDAYDEWRENAVDNNELIQDVLDDTEDEVKEVTKASDNLKKKVVDEVIPAVESELIAVRNITSAYAKQRAEIKKTISHYEDLITTIREAIAAQAALAGESSIGYNEKGQVTDYSWAMADYLANKGGAYGDAHWERLVSERNKKLETDEYSKYADGADDFEEMMEKYYKYKTQGVDNELTKYVEDVIANKQYWDQNKVENLIDEFATGGYTGAWGPEGRLAVVHEKELMLNQEDTVNFLQGIGLLREIAQMIDLEAMRNQLGALPYLPIANMQGAGGLLEQSVHIEANFPGVSDRYEIEEAFNNILNTATQYANRKI